LVNEVQTDTSSSTAGRGRERKFYSMRDENNADPPALKEDRLDLIQIFTRKYKIWCGYWHKLTLTTAAILTKAE